MQNKCYNISNNKGETKMNTHQVVQIPNTYTIPVQTIIELTKTKIDFPVTAIPTKTKTTFNIWQQPKVTTK